VQGEQNVLMHKNFFQICITSHVLYEQAQYGLCCLVTGRQRGAQLSGTSLAWILLFSVYFVIDTNFYNRAPWGMLMCRWLNLWWIPIK